MFTAAPDTYGRIALDADGRKHSLSENYLILPRRTQYVEMLLPPVLLASPPLRAQGSVDPATETDNSDEEAIVGGGNGNANTDRCRSYYSRPSNPLYRANVFHAPRQLRIDEIRHDGTTPQHDERHHVSRKLSQP